MSVHTPDHEPSLFDPKPGVDAANQPEPPALVSAADTPAEAASAKKPRKAAGAKKEDSVSAETELANASQDRAIEVGESASLDGEAVLASADDAGEPASAKTDDEDAEQELPKNDRKRLAEQLDALRKKEAELLRALAITDHPDLADAIRTIEARVYCVARADAKLAQGLSKSEARRQEVLTKKLASLREKRSELDTQIAALEAEAQELGAARLSDFQRERQDALQALMVALATHDSALDAAGLDVRSLLPELSGLMPELEAIARSVSETRADA